MPPNIKLILNPICNHGRSLQNAADLRPILANQDAEWSGTEYPGHAIELARQAGETGAELVVALGGDGTVHEVVNGLMQVPPEKRPALGIIPLGSGNDFAHILQIPSDPSLAMRSALSGVQSTSNAGAHTDDGPFSRTSVHQAFRGPIPMWFGTKSSRMPIPRSTHARASRSNAASPPSSGSRRPWSTTS